MSKKTNTLLFVLGGTVFNILVTGISIILLVIICSIVVIPKFPESGPWVFGGSFVGGIVISFFVYRLVIKIIMKKVDMEKYFDPIFGRRPRKL